MDLYAVLDQIVALLQRRGRVTYNALKLQFTLDDDQLAVLTDELLYAHPQVVKDAGALFPYGTILSQEPAPDAVVPEGAKAKVTISARPGGKTETAAASNFSYQVPQGSSESLVRILLVDQHGEREVFNGLRAPASTAGNESNFTAELTAAELAAFNAATPNRFAFKHAHSQQNPEMHWGRNVLQSIELALFLLNERFGNISKHDTLVIASSVSNGGGASLLAAQQDAAGLIDGVAVGEPQIQPRPSSSLVVARGGVPVAAQAKGLYDYTTLGNLFQPCASQSAALAASPLLGLIVPARAAARCAALENAGLLDGIDTAAQASQALAFAHEIVERVAREVRA